jgi:hypothetical protein
MVTQPPLASNSHYGSWSHIFDRQNGCKPYSVVDDCAVEWLINALTLNSAAVLIWPGTSLVSL